MNERSRTRIMISSRARLKSAQKVGAALGPGIPAGLVAIGMLIALKQLRISIHMLSAKGIGAIIGAYYCCGVEPEAIRQYAKEMFADKSIQELFFSDARISKVGLSSSERAEQYLIGRIGSNPDFDDLKIPLYVTSTDEMCLEEIILNKGRVLDAVRASCTMPPPMRRKRISDRISPRDAFFSPLSTGILYQNGADFVFAIQAKHKKSMSVRHLPLSVGLEPYFLRLLGWKTRPEVDLSKPECDVLLRPRIVPIPLSVSPQQIDHVIEEGIKVTYDAMHLMKRQAPPGQS